MKRDIENLIEKAVENITSENELEVKEKFLENIREKEEEIKKGGFGDIIKLTKENPRLLIKYNESKKNNLLEKYYPYCDSYVSFVRREITFQKEEEERKKLINLKIEFKEIIEKYKEKFAELNSDIKSRVTFLYNECDERSYSTYNFFKEELKKLLGHIDEKIKEKQKDPLKEPFVNELYRVYTKNS